MSSGTITVRRPRGTGSGGTLRESGVAAVCDGLAAGDFELALRGLLGPAAIRRLRAVWSSEFEMWAKRSLTDCHEAIYVKAGLRDKAALRGDGSHATGRKRFWPSHQATGSQRTRGRRSFGVSRLEASQRRSY